MKKILLLFLLITSLNSCLEIETSATINENGSGIVTQVIDMSKAVDLINMMPPDSIEKLAKNKIDSSFSYADLKDWDEKSAQLSEDEKAVLKSTTGHIKMNFEEGVIKMTVTAKFQNYEQMKNAFYPKYDALNKLPLNSDVKNDSTEDNPLFKFLGSVKDISMNVKEGWIEKKYIGKPKEDTEDRQKMLEGMSQIQTMMGGLTQKTIIHLPRPVKKVTSKSTVEISEDKLMVTITTDLVEAMNDPLIQEYTIEY